MMENAFYYSTNFKKHTVEARMTWPRDPTLRDKVTPIFVTKILGCAITVQLLCAV